MTKWRKTKKKSVTFCRYCTSSCTSSNYGICYVMFRSSLKKKKSRAHVVRRMNLIML